MQLEQLRLRNFRCFSETQLEFHPDLNWIVGQNASGKTSLLEALFFLGHGRSFRSNRPDRLVQSEAGSFEIVARLRRDGRQQTLGVGRKEGATTARLAGETLQSMTQAAKVLPVVVLDSGMNQLIAGGPGERRRWLDWGVFHVEHHFLETWRSYQQALRQRNMALRSGASERTIAPWTSAVASAGGELSSLRLKYFEALRSGFVEYSGIALPGVSLEADYRRGWSQDETLQESLHRHLARDRETGNTRSGPHRADIQFRIEGMPAEERLSRGQQKMLAGALWLAQVNRFTQKTGQRPLLLVDDLAAELDGDNLVRFLELLRRQNAQLVLTAIGDADINRTGLTEGHVFHVEHGKVSGGATPDGSL
ncbi:MAG TPA: DNA replication/repair protein RecF [Gammaproteobacteria bacterium]